MLLTILRRSFFVLACGSVAAMTVPSTVAGQAYRIRGVSPIFDGWEERPDGTRLFYFGYLNRNPSDVTIPVGVDNNFEPGLPDRRQPTTFLEGRHEHVFTIVAPKELTGKLIWTIKSEMGVQTANASFDQLYILAVREGDAPNAKAPEIAVADVTARVGQPVLLSPSITPAANSERADTEGGASEAVGLNVEWSTYRGRGRVAFSAAPSAAQAASVEAGRRRSRAEPERPGIHTVACGMKPAAGCGAAIAVFGEPGVYTLRAAARQDGMQGLAFVRVTVNP